MFCIERLKSKLLRTVYKMALQAGTLLRITLFALCVVLWILVLYCSLFNDANAAVFSYFGVFSTVLATKYIFSGADVNTAYVKIVNFLAMFLIHSGAFLMIFEGFWTTSFYSVCLGVLLEKMIHDVKKLAQSNDAHQHLNTDESHRNVQAESTIQEYKVSSNQKNDYQVPSFTSLRKHVKVEQDFKKLEEKELQESLEVDEKRTNDFIRQMEKRSQEFFGQEQKIEVNSHSKLWLNKDIQHQLLDKTSKSVENLLTNISANLKDEVERSVAEFVGELVSESEMHVDSIENVHLLHRERKDRAEQNACENIEMPEKLDGSIKRSMEYVPESLEKDIEELIELLAEIKEDMAHVHPSITEKLLGSEGNETTKDEHANEPFLPSMLAASSKDPNINEFSVDTAKIKSNEAQLNHYVQLSFETFDKVDTFELRDTADRTEDNSNIRKQYVKSEFNSYSNCTETREMSRMHDERKDINAVSGSISHSEIVNDTVEAGFRHEMMQPNISIDQLKIQNIPAKNPPAKHCRRPINEVLQPQGPLSTNKCEDPLCERHTNYFMENESKISKSHDAFARQNLVNDSENNAKLLQRQNLSSIQDENVNDQTLQSVKSFQPYERSERGKELSAEERLSSKLQSKTCESSLKCISEQNSEDDSFSIAASNFNCKDSTMKRSAKLMSSNYQNTPKSVRRNLAMEFAAVGKKSDESETKASVDVKNGTQSSQMTLNIEDIINRIDLSFIYAIR